MRNPRSLSFVLSTILLALGPATAFADELDLYWPLDSPQMGWRLAQVSSGNRIMTVTNTNVNADEFIMWFFNKVGQQPGAYDREHYRYCDNPGANPWLWMDKYSWYIPPPASNSGWYETSVQSTQILFTPNGGPTTYDLIANGTYAQCGEVGGQFVGGQPYLFFNQTLGSYRIQVWGTVGNNSNMKWYWDANVYAAEEVTNNCLNPPETREAIKVSEAWWSNFSCAGQEECTGSWAGSGSGEVDSNGVPTGNNVVPFRTVWHAEGQIPYFKIGTSACVDAIWSVP